MFSHRQGLSVPSRIMDPVCLEQFLLAALETAPTGMMVLNMDRSVRLLTGGAAALLGLPPAFATAGMPLAFVLANCPSLEPESVRSLLMVLEEPGGEPCEVFLSAATSSGVRSLSVDIRPADFMGWLMSFADSTRTRQNQDWLLQHASSDAVTGLRNRQNFVLMLQDRLAVACAGSGTRVHALFLIGLHRFKQVNDVLGLGGADTMLRLVAERLSAELQDDDLLARFSSDEFALFLSREVAGADLPRYADHLFSVLSAPYVLEEQVVSLSAHIGVSLAPEHGETAELLLGHAGLALQETTTRGTAPVCFFTSDLTELAHQRRNLEAELREALGRGEFQLYYQAQVDLHRNCVTGLEALIRWCNPRRGMVSPAEFIPLAEQTGIINEIGTWVLREACREACHWPDDVTVAVNASPLQFETGVFAQSVSDALAETGLCAQRLEIEITESLLLRDTGTVLATLSALHDMGVRLVLDDFGTGYASLSQLSRFRFDKIKIDRSFVSPIIESPENSAIVRSIAALGKSLGIPTTAEGVENASQLEHVRADGCTSVQGYYFSRPVPSQEVAGVLLRLHQPVVHKAA